MSLIEASSSLQSSREVNAATERNDGNDQSKESMLLGKKMFTFLRDWNSRPLQITLNEV